MGLEEALEGQMVLGRATDVIKWARKNSLWPALFGLACCAIEMMSTSASKYDIARFGAEVFRASPRQADLMIVAGRVSRKMAPVLRQIYDQMPEPKWVISMGACASTGGIFNNYALVQGVDEPVKTSEVALTLSCAEHVDSVAADRDEPCFTHTSLLFEPVGSTPCCRGSCTQ